MLALAAAALVGCGGAGGTGASDTFKGTEVENRPVILEGGSEYTQQLVDQLRNCSVEGDIEKFVSSNGLLDRTRGTVNADGSRSFEISQYENGELARSFTVTVGTLVVDKVSPLLVYEITCSSGAKPPPAEDQAKAASKLRGASPIHKLLCAAADDEAAGKTGAAYVIYSSPPDKLSGNQTGRKVAMIGRSTCKRARILGHYDAIPPAPAEGTLGVVLLALPGGGKDKGWVQLMSLITTDSEGFQYDHPQFDREVVRQVRRLPIVEGTGSK